MCIGENMAVFRTEEGKACVLDAYCPHLGAHLGIGGRVVGDCIECPFHGWQFNGNDGKCTSIPYSKGKGRRSSLPFNVNVKKNMQMIVCICNSHSTSSVECAGQKMADPRSQWLHFRLVSRRVGQEPRTGMDRARTGRDQFWPMALSRTNRI